ncbi:lectin-like protein [Flavilitoribacter nigricans]|uniref:C-type lectin domain-containing protein n=1 Tax=Flavilitoribacter nigricans (strain ATCC 23147 / DSM 23189 / NBRC 102662 / NCIMB 1420 / SS-2) TaxID=1122177 RepID=A0A2D0NGV0_FLAN2|nr:lectin-like protein [Flavilitoribacter nigricans]PHN07399.1 hypothetical protein CRP01_07150 [Flavilitoribacter nigricans DSM 23189 = NBRC 102662]
MEQITQNYTGRSRWLLRSCLLIACFLSTIYLESQNSASSLGDNSILLTIKNRPNYNTFRQLVGVNGGTNWDGHASPNPVSGVIWNARSFHLMEIDYRYQKNPANYRIQPCLADCDEAYMCYPANSCELPGPGSEKSTLAYYKARYCNNWARNFPTVFASLETINPYYKNGCPTPSFTVRPWPDKWYSAEEWGHNTAAIEDNARIYAEAFAATFCPNDPSKQCVVNVLEVGNEPWGIPGREAYWAISRGMVAGMINYYGSDQPENWRMKLSTAAFQAHDPKSSSNDYIGDMVPEDVRPYFSYVNIHPYAFSIEERSLTAPPESPYGQFRSVENLEQWRQTHMPHARLNISEFGWNSRDNGANFPGVGEATQAIYTIRSLLMASRYGADKAFIYSLFDRPEDDLFNSTGLISNTDLHEKKAFRSVARLMDLMGEKIFLKALSEDADEQNGMYAYLYGDANGKPTHLVAWLPDETNHEETFPLGRSVRSLLFADPAIQPARTGYFRYLAWTDEFDANITKRPIVSVDLNNPDQHYLILSAVPVVIPLQETDVYINAHGEVVSGGTDSCDGPAIPNTILGDESDCKPFQSSAVVPAEEIPVGLGDMIYQWQYSDNPWHLTWKNVEGATGPAFAPGLISETAWFRRGVRRPGCPDFSYSNPVLKDILPDDCNEPEEDCLFNDPPDGFRALAQDEEHAYLLSDKKENWYDAREICEGIGGQLVRIDNDTEQQLILDELRQAGTSTAFIGLQDQDLDGQFEWTDGSTADYLNWASGNPFSQRRPGGVYVGAWSNGPWYLTHFLTEKNFICEQSCSPPENLKINIGKTHRSTGTRVYPNPTRDMIHLSVSEYFFDRVIVLQASGEEIIVENFPLQTQTASISLQDLPPGLYFLRIRTSDGDWISKRVIRQR